MLNATSGGAGSQPKAQPPPPAAMPPMHQPAPQQAAHPPPLATPYSQAAMAQPPPYAHLAPSIPQAHTPVHHPTPPIPPPAAMYPPASAHMSHTQSQAPPYYRPPPVPGMPQAAAPPPAQPQPTPGAQAPAPALDPAQRVSGIHVPLQSRLYSPHPVFTGDVDAGSESDARADKFAPTYGARPDSATGMLDPEFSSRPRLTKMLFNSENSLASLFECCRQNASSTLVVSVYLHIVHSVLSIIPHA